MQKAHLYEAVFLVNQGLDQAVRGLERVKKAAGAREGLYRDTLVALERGRARVNLQFFADMEQTEKRDARRHEPRERNKPDSSARTAP